MSQNSEICNKEAQKTLDLNIKVPENHRDVQKRYKTFNNKYLTSFKLFSVEHYNKRFFSVDLIDGLNKTLLKFYKLIFSISSDLQDFAMLYKLFPESDKKYLAKIYNEQNCSVMDTIKQVNYF